LLACRGSDGKPIDDGLRQLAQAALQTPAPVVSAFDDPACAPVIGAAAVTAAGPAAIVLADRSSLLVLAASLGTPCTGPVCVLPGLIAGCCAFAIVVVGIFDTRRRKALARAEEVRSSFLAVVSHELRTPLTVLKGFVDTLLARWDHLENDQRQQLVERLGPQV